MERSFDSIGCALHEAKTIPLTSLPIDILDSVTTKMLIFIYFFHFNFHIVIGWKIDNNQLIYFVGRS